jgi:hypothetical protein
VQAVQRVQTWPGLFGQLRLRFLPQEYLWTPEREREPEPQRAGRGCRDRRGGARLFPFLPSSLPCCYYWDSTRIFGSLAHTLSLSQCACRQEPDRGTSIRGRDGWISQRSNSRRAWVPFSCHYHCGYVVKIGGEEGLIVGDLLHLLLCLYYRIS